MDKQKSAQLTAGLLDAYGLGVTRAKTLKRDAGMLSAIKPLANMIDSAIYWHKGRSNYDDWMLRQDIADALVSLLALASVAGIDGVLEAIEEHKREREGED